MCQAWPGRARKERARARGRVWFSEPDLSSTVRMRIQCFDATASALIGPLAKSFPESLFFTSKARGVSVSQITEYWHLYARTDRRPPPKKNSSDLHEPHRSPKCMITKWLAAKSAPLACLNVELDRSVYNIGLVINTLNQALILFNKRQMSGYKVQYTKHFIFIFTQVGPTSSLKKKKN